MDLNAVKEWLEGGKDEKERAAPPPVEEWEEALPCKFFDAFTVKGINIDLIEHGRVLCSLKVPPRLINVTQSRY